ncbi:unnamed protein product [Eretmochelys imbricata]
MSWTSGLVFCGPQTFFIFVGFCFFVFYLLQLFQQETKIVGLQFLVMSLMKGLSKKKFIHTPVHMNKPESCSFPQNQCYQKLERSLVHNVTMGGILHYNRMFVKLFVLCKLNEPNHIGFSKCLYIRRSICQHQHGT